VVRNCTKIPGDVISKLIQINEIQFVELYIDASNYQEILAVLSSNIDKSRRILYELFQSRYNDDLYGKENFSNETRNLTAFKYKLGKGKNIRIYCKEYLDEQIISISKKSRQFKKVVLISVYYKKSYDLDKKLRQHLTSIASYEYEFEE
jgi:hypothetical protein